MALTSARRVESGKSLYANPYYWGAYYATGRETNIPDGRVSCQPRKTSQRERKALLSQSQPLHNSILCLGVLCYLSPLPTMATLPPVEVFSPNNGHPVGAVFGFRGVFFTDAELNDPEGERDGRMHRIAFLFSTHTAMQSTLSSSPARRLRPFAVTAIPDTNHKIKPGRRLGNNWEIAIAVNGQLSRVGLTTPSRGATRVL